MDLQSILTNAEKASRDEKFKKSDQLTLGELIAKLEAIDDQSKEIRFDFGYFRPSGLCSWRGSYAELAITYDEETEVTVAKFIDDLKQAIGKTFEGYKGGDFVMGRQTPVWVANYGESGDTGVVGVLDKYIVIIQTTYCEY